MADMMIVALIPPGRFPTVVPDPGDWWSAVAGSDAYRALRLSANASFWRVVCSPAIAALLGVTADAEAAELRASGARAGAALEVLRDPATYTSAARYIAAVTPVAEHLAVLNRAQGELHFSFEAGVRVAALNYDDSHALVAYAGQRTALAALVVAALDECPRAIGLLAVNVTSPEDLLTALVAVAQLRRERPELHACLADHGYENFSLSPHLERLRAAGTLDSIFDSIVEAKDDRDLVLPALAREAAAGRAPRGFLRRSDLPAADVLASSAYVAPPPVETFAGEPIFWTRLSQRRCYWSRCTFCVQNAKYDEPQPPSLAEVPAAIDRLTALVAAGYTTIYFSDEALSPALLERFCRAILARGLEFRWACRCKLEKAFTPELSRLMRAAGCFEVLFGLESISPRVLRRMDKYVEGLNAARVRSIFEDLNAAGIGLHVNLIGAFPGDTPADVIASVEFVRSALARLRGATFLLNRFALFPATPILDDPAAFGVEPEPVAGDMPSRYPYHLAPQWRASDEAVDRLLPAARARLFTGLGWDGLGDGIGPAAAVELYFGSGHGAIFKAQESNPFANPLLQPLTQEV